MATYAKSCPASNITELSDINASLSPSPNDLLEEEELVVQPDIMLNRGGCCCSSLSLPHPELGRSSFAAIEEESKLRAEEVLPLLCFSSVFALLEQLLSGSEFAQPQLICVSSPGLGAVDSTLEVEPARDSMLCRSA